MLLDVVAQKRHSKAEKAKIMNRYDQVPFPTQNITWESDKSTRKHNTRESHEVSLFPAGDHKTARNRQDCIIKINMKHNYEKDPQKALPWNGQQKSPESLNMFNSTYRTLSSYMIKTHKLMFGSQEGKPRKL